MKILIVSTYFPPMNSIASLRPYSWAKYWSAAGHDVTVLTTEKYDFDTGLDKNCSGFTVVSVPMPSWHRKVMARATASRLSDCPGPQRHSIRRFVVRIARRFRERTGVLKDYRMPSHLDPWYFRACAVVQNDVWDLVVTTFSPYVCHLIGLKLKTTGKAKRWIADYRDLWTQSHMFPGLWPFRYLEGLIEGRVNKSADFLTTVSEPLANQLREAFPGSNVAVVENGFDRDDLASIPRECFFDDDKVRIVYTGSIYPHYSDPSPLFAAVRSVAMRQGAEFLNRLEIVFVGHGATWIKELADHWCVSAWVRCENLLPRSQALHMQRDAHILLFLEYDKPGFKGILTGKLFEYLSSGTEVWACGSTESTSAGQIIQRAKCGVLFGGDATKIETHLVLLLASGKKPIVQPVSKIVDSYARDGQALRMLELVSG